MGQLTSKNQNVTEGRDIPSAADRTLKFPFLQDEETIMYMKCSKVLIVLRGLRGSGKSYLAQRLKETFGHNCQVCSMDDYFSQGTYYRYDPTKLADASRYCREMAAEACRNGRHVVVVDDLNVELADLKFFVQLAYRTNYVHLVEEPRTPWKFNAMALASRNRGNMGESEIVEMMDRWEEVVPIYFAWFINVGDSVALANIAEAYLDECTNIPEFVEQFKEMMTFEGYDDIRDYFHLTANQQIFHCTTHFCQDRTSKDEYMMIDTVQSSYGSKTSLSVIGFVITPHTFLARVKLSSQQLLIWGQDDYEQPAIQEAVDVVRSDARTLKHVCENLVDSPRADDKVCITTLRPYANPEKRTSQCFQPTKELGRRAHITLGCANGVKPVQAGFDLIDAVELEQSCAKKSVPTFNVGCAIVRKYGEATWVVYPNNLYVIDALFAFFMSERK